MFRFFRQLREHPFLIVIGVAGHHVQGRLGQLARHRLGRDHAFCGQTQVNLDLDFMGSALSHSLPKAKVKLPHSTDVLGEIPCACFGRCVTVSPMLNNIEHQQTNNSTIEYTWSGKSQRAWIKQPANPSHR